MIRTLLLKELRAQRVFIFLAIGLILVDIVDDLTLHSNFSLTQLSGELSGLGMMLLTVSFAIGSGLLIREIDGGTLSFIDGLPTVRLQLFIAKVIVGFVILQTISVVTMGMAMLRHWTDSNSLNHAVHVHLLLAQHVILLVPIMLGLGAGLLLGFLRSMSWLVFAACGMTIAALSEKWPAVSALNTLRLFDARFNGNHYQWPIQSLVVQFAMIVLTMTVAAWLFTRKDSKQSATAIDTKKWITIPITILSVLLVLVAFYYLVSKDSSPDTRSEYQGGAHFEKMPPGNASTIHYTFSYPANQSESVAELLQQADRVFGHVADTLHIEGGGSIDVDLNGSMANTEGTAFPNRIRMNMNKVDELDTLAHETTHVFARRLVGDAGEKQLNGLVAFNEGLARWVECRLSGTKNCNRDDELGVAVISARHVLDAHSLTIIQTMRNDIDENLKYPLGRLFVDSLVKRYGIEAPRNILKTIGREDFPRDLDGFALWEIAFQMTGYDISLVFDDYSRAMKTLELKYQKEIAALPRLHGDLVVRNDNKEEVGVELYTDKDVPKAWRTEVRFKPSVNSSLDEYLTIGVTDDVGWIIKDLLGTGDVCFQPGITNGHISIYEAWTCLPLSSASDWRVRK